jgi:hypothetical protein
MNFKSHLQKTLERFRRISRNIFRQASHAKPFSKNKLSLETTQKLPSFPKEVSKDTSFLLISKLITKNLSSIQHQLTSLYFDEKPRSKIIRLNFSCGANTKNAAKANRISSYVSFLPTFERERLGGEGQEEIAGTRLKMHS